MSGALNNLIKLKIINLSTIITAKNKKPTVIRIIIIIIIC